MERLSCTDVYPETTSAPLISACAPGTCAGLLILDKQETGADDSFVAS
jgi:hypothetical protein